MLTSLFGAYGKEARAKQSEPIISEEFQKEIANLKMVTDLKMVPESQEIMNLKSIPETNTFSVTPVN